MKNLLTFSAISLILLFALSSAPPVHADVEVNDCSNDSAFNTAMLGGDLITFNCGGNHEIATITLSKTYTISSTRTIDGDNNKVTLDGGHERPLFSVNKGVTFNLQNINLTDGYNPNGNGGTVINNGALSLDHVTIRGSGNAGYDGGAIYTIGPMTATNSTLNNNLAGRGGVIAASGVTASVTIADSVLHDNLVSSNVSGRNRGGAIYLDINAVLQISSSQIYNNSAGVAGGAIFLDGGSTAQISSSDVYSNSAQFGGAISDVNGTLRVTNTTLTNNRADDGGGIESGSQVFLTNVALTDNEAKSDGGGISSGGTLSITNSILNANKSKLSGGGLFVNSGTTSVSGSLFTQNAEASPQYGGGGAETEIHGTLNVFDSTFYSNTAYFGAGVDNANGGKTNLTNVTLYGNTAANSGGGFNNFSATASLSNTTISNNVAITGGGINNQGGTSLLHLFNILLNNNTAGGNCHLAQPLATLQSSLSSDGTCSFGAGRDNVTIKLGKLETNGGNLAGVAQVAMLTQRLLPGSHAIDAGTNNSCPGNDERGVLRPKGPLCDVGAFEFAPCPTTPGKPSLIAPANKAVITTATVALDWAGPDCAKTWNVVVRKGSKTGTVVFSKSKLKLSQATTGSLSAGEYFWQVSACAGTSCTAGSWWKFMRQ